jgi:hypothetical protein
VKISVAVALIKLVGENSVPGVISDEGGQMQVFPIAFTVAPFRFWFGRGTGVRLKPSSLL